MRASELASLSRESFNLSEGVIRVEAAYSKHRKEDELPLHSDLAERLREWFGELDVARARETLKLRTPIGLEKLFPGKWAAGRHGAEMLRSDLPADIPYQTEQGAVDFHAIRHTYVSLLAASGVHPKTAQELAHHSDINLTMSRYTHFRMSDLRESIQALPSLPTGSASLRATGTTDCRGTETEAKFPKRLPRLGARRGAQLADTSRGREGTTDHVSEAGAEEEEPASA